MEGIVGVDEGPLIRRGLRLAAGFVRAHPGPAAAAILGSLVMAVGTVASTVVLGWLTDDVVLAGIESTPARRGRLAVVLAVLGVAVARSAGVMVRRYFAGMTVLRCTEDLQLALADQFLDLPPEEVRVASKGTWLAHADSDVSVATDILSPFPFVVGTGALVVVSILSLGLLDWPLMVVAVAMVPAIAVANHVNAVAVKGPAVDVRHSIGRVSAIAAESFDGAVVIKTLGREQAELDRFSDAARTLRDDATRLGRVRAVFAAVLDLIPDIAIVTLVGVGAWRVGNDHITTGELVQAVAMFSLLAFPLRVIGYFLGDLPPGVVAHDRVAHLLARPTAAPRGGSVLEAGHALPVGVDRLSVRYGETVAVDDVSFDVAPGEHLALVGATGCGKSSLLMAMVDMVPAHTGVVRIGGVAVPDIDPRSLAASTAMVWQEPFLLDASVRDNIAFGLQVDDAAIVVAARAAGFHDVALALADQYDTVVGERGTRLSGGQRQRLALARALVRRPALLLLDDATSAVDPIVEHAILDEIRALGATVVAVAHRRSSIELADRVAMMSDGRIVAMGTHTELMGRPEYVALLDAYRGERAP